MGVIVLHFALSSDHPGSPPGHHSPPPSQELAQRSENYSLSSNLAYFPDGSQVKNPSAMQEAQEMSVQALGQEDLPEEETATHSSILA